MKSEVGYGDRLISVTLPATPIGSQYWHIGGGIQEITVGRLEGPMGWYLTAQITFEDSRPDIIVPLHMAESFEVQYGDG